MEHMYNLTVLPASTAAILISSWCKAEHLNGYFITNSYLLITLIPTC
jgi:hypothetical protein